MGEAQEHQLHIRAKEAEEEKLPEYANVTHQSIVPRLKYKLWLRVAICTFFILSGQSVAILLLRLYYEKGGKSKWLAAIIQLAGFPILFFFRIIPSQNSVTNGTHTNQPSILVIASVYVGLGLLIGTVGVLGSIGLLYLPVSTFSLITASQLVFNALFSFFLNSQKFTPFIINSIVLLTISSTLLVIQTDSANSTGVSKGKYLIGFLCTLLSAVVTGLVLSLTQLSFQKVLKRRTFRTVLDLVIYESLVATCATLVGLFASGEWKDLKTEMEEFALGKLFYVIILILIALAWQAYLICAVSLIFEVSAIFSNVIGTLGLPLIPVLAVIFFHDKMEGVKVIALLLAIWGFASYIYQHYLDDCKSKTQNESVDKVSKASPTERG